MDFWNPRLSRRYPNAIFLELLLWVLYLCTQSVRVKKFTEVKLLRKSLQIFHVRAVSRSLLCPNTDKPRNKSSPELSGSTRINEG